MAHTMKTNRLLSFCALVAFALSPAVVPSQTAAPAGPPHITKGAKLFISPMDGFETTLMAAILKKKVPVTVVMDKAAADYVLSGSSALEKAGWAKTIFVSPQPHASASITVVDAHSGALAFAYNVDKSSAMRGQQSTAEACAKHLKEAIEKE